MINQEIINIKEITDFKIISTMETKIIKTIHEWLPEFVETNNQYTEYILLKNLAEYCRHHFALGEKEKANRVIKIISLMYNSGNLHDRNAIENEFLGVLAKDEAPSSLKNHLRIFPENLKTAYLKTILEN
jgi:hypothetical protein